MSLKDALTNSLLMFVAATCVVLIVKALPQTPAAPQAVAPQAAAPSGGSGPGAALAAPSGGPAPAPTLAVAEGVKVFYLHGNIRCPTCRTIEACAQEAVQTGFAEELKTGAIQWQVINYESPGNEHYAKDYDVVAPTVVLAKFKDGKQVDWKALPEVWEHTGDQAALVAFVQANLRQFLGGAGASAPASPDLTRPNPVRPTADTAPLPLPIPE
jgi:hypothetical protein